MRFNVFDRLVTNIPIQMIDLRKTFLLVNFVCAASVSLLAQSFLLETDAAGLGEVSHTNGAAAADYDLDGDLDIMFIGTMRYQENDPTSWNHLYSNNGNGTFTEVTGQAGIATLATPERDPMMGHRFGASWGDYDADGYPDLFITNARAASQLYRNNGDGTFSDLAATAGISWDEADEPSSACWWDYDNDADLDLYVSQWIGGNRLFENDGSTFVDVSGQSGLDDRGQTWVSTPIDANNDGWLDLYVINDFGANRFYVNRGDRTFEEATYQYGLQDVGDGMGVAVGDYNNDGFFDIYLTNIAKIYPNPFFRNSGEGTFSNVAEELGIDDAGWGWGAAFFDCEHDGDEDLYVVNGMPVDPGENFFFLNTADQGIPGFIDRSGNTNTNGSADARSLVSFDYDDDGDLDLLVANASQTLYLYENMARSENWLKIELQGIGKNRYGVGAIVRVRTGSRQFHRFRMDAGFLNQNLQPLHVGVANANLIDEITVEWPGGGVDKISKRLWVNQRLTLKEGEGLVEWQLSTPGPASAETFYLHGNYPNPFNGETQIEFDIETPGEVDLTIFNILGQKIRQHSSSFPSGGRQRISWDGRGVDGQTVNSGIYFYRLRYQAQSLAGRMFFIK